MRTRLGLLAALPLVVFAALPAGSAAAQNAVKPYVMLMFDSSGSMRYPVCRDGYSFINGDNSNECPGNLLACSSCVCPLCGNPNPLGCDNTLHDDARLFKLKAGASAVIGAYGEVTFGLARFHQEPNTFMCHHAWDDIRFSGGWVGAPDSCANAPLGSGFNRADVLVPFSDNNQPNMLSWLNNCDDYPTAGSCQFGVEPGTGTEPVTPFNCAAGSLCAECGTGCDKELRGAGWTAIAGSLFHLRTAFFNGPTGVIATDTQSACRPYKVILLTDGDDQCPGSQIAQAGLLYNNPGKSIPVHVIGFANSSLQSNLDQVALAGGTTAAVMVDNEVSLALEIAQIVSESVLHETCNGIDDDCNGRCDEAWPEVGAPSGCSNASTPQSCTVGLGICRNTGIYECRPDGLGSQCSVGPKAGLKVEICDNGKDDDCDGLIDEGCIPCIPQAEVCNGKDDNCNGLIDEQYASTPCGSDIGACARGNTLCVNGSVVCQGSTAPTAELCDSIDNNCDTVVDAFTETCYTDPAGAPFSGGCSLATGVCVGRCQLGLRLCTNSVWGGCAGVIGPTPEICNGKDDNCDGQVDEGVLTTCTDYNTCNSYQTCAACLQTPIEICNGKDDDCNGKYDDIAAKPCGTDTGECKKGITACDALGQPICQGQVGPTAETCNNKDDDCNGKIDDSVTDPGAGATCGSSQAECTPGTMQCVAGAMKCVGGVLPSAEICDGKDNDCDGTADNNLAATQCGSDVGECKVGANVCSGGKFICQGAVGPSVELCDGKDNDCNGLTDDNPDDAGKSCGSSVGACAPGIEQCLAGKLVCVGELGPVPEVCDGKDNDCNGLPDDGVAGSGKTCGTSVGACTTGTMFCQSTSKGWAMVCAGGVGPKAEICDGKDNNCDGDTDESFPEDGQVCGTGDGQCAAGTWSCISGKLVCAGSSGPAPEICDGKDNDCNGKIDDNVPQDGQPCGSSQGECKPGALRCIGGTLHCTGDTGPRDEICDGKDNNCDGKTDEAAACPGNSACVDGGCLVPCGNGEFNCPGGTRCENGYCIPLPCASVTCPATERCVDGMCIAKCVGVTCEVHELCQAETGTCVDDTCLTKGCPDSQICVAYQCKDSPCSGVTCELDEMCVAGDCKPTCVGKQCAPGQVCVQGACKSDPCSGHKCQENQRCVVEGGQAKCAADPCRAVACLPGETCVEGKCGTDPCLTTTCPSYLRCELTHDNQPNCVPLPNTVVPATTRLLAAGSGGCTCEVGVTPRPDTWWPALLLLAAVWLRRRPKLASKGRRRPERG